MLTDFENTRLSTEVGMIGISLSYEFLEKALTHQSIMEGAIRPNQFIRIKSVSVDENINKVDIDCGVFDYLIN